MGIPELAIGAAGAGSLMVYLMRLVDLGLSRLEDLRRHGG